MGCSIDKQHKNTKIILLYDTTVEKVVAVPVLSDAKNHPFMKKRNGSNIISTLDCKKNDSPEF